MPVLDPARPPQQGFPMLLTQAISYISAEERNEAYLRYSHLAFDLKSPLSSRALLEQNLTLDVLRKIEDIRSQNTFEEEESSLFHSHSADDYIRQKMQLEEQVMFVPPEESHMEFDDEEHTELIRAAAAAADNRSQQFAKRRQFKKQQDLVEREYILKRLDHIERVLFSEEKANNQESKRFKLGNTVKFKIPKVRVSAGVSPMSTILPQKLASSASTVAWSVAGGGLAGRMKNPPNPQKISDLLNLNAKFAKVGETIQALNRNARRPKKANHGARPCSRISRRRKRYAKYKKQMTLY